MKEKGSQIGNFLPLKLIYTFVILLIFYLQLHYSSTVQGETITTDSPVKMAEEEIQEPKATDPNRHSAFLLPSAHTLSKGDVSMDIMGLYALGVRFGITDRIQLSLGFPWFSLYGEGRVKVWDKKNNIFSIGAGAGIPIIVEDADILWLVNPVYTFGGDDLNLTLGAAVGGISSHEGVLAIPYISVMKRVNRKMKIFIQVADGIAGGDVFGEEHQGEHYIFAMPGIRVHGRKFSCDISVMMPVHFKDLESYFIVPLPTFSIHF